MTNKKIVDMTEEDRVRQLLEFRWGYPESDGWFSATNSRLITDVGVPWRRIRRMYSSRFECLMSIREWFESLKYGKASIKKLDPIFHSTLKLTRFWVVSIETKWMPLNTWRGFQPDNNT